MICKIYLRAIKLNQSDSNCEMQTIGRPVFMRHICDTKVRHRSEESAENAVRKYNERVVLSVYPVTTYRCRWHKCFHIGHTRPPQVVAEYNRIAASIGFRKTA